MRSAVFIHTNPKQIIGALVGRHAMVRNSAAPERFDVRILQTSDFPALQRFEGRRYLREGKQVVWRNDDLQSFTPLRFAVPEQMGYAGRAVLTDPDVFAIADINELLDRDMGCAAVMARPMAGDMRSRPDYASSVMLMDCARLTHWHWEADFEKVFQGEHDYRDWNWLRLEPIGSVAALEPQWNDFDRLESDTKLLHNTQRRTQPWKCGLPVDFTLRGNTLRKRMSAGVRRVHALLTGSASPAGHYVAHPDPSQERYFFRLLGECLEQGSISEATLRSEIDRRHVRADAFERAHEAMRGPAVSSQRM